MVTRPSLQVLMRSLAPPDAAFIDAATRGATLGEAAAEAAAKGDMDLQHILTGHFRSGTFQNLA